MKYDRNKEYLTIEYTRKNVYGLDTKYELLVEKNEARGYLLELFFEEFGLGNQQFKALLSAGFLNYDEDKLVERYHQDLLNYYEEDIEEDYKEQLEEERWFYGLIKTDEDEDLYRNR